MSTFAAYIQVKENTVGSVLDYLASPAASVFMLNQTPVVVRGRKFTLSIVVGSQESA